MLVSAVMVLLATSLLAQNARTVVNDAIKAMGAANLKTIQYSGSGSTGTLGQNINPESGWPLVKVEKYSREIDFDIPPQWPAQFDIFLNPYGFLKQALANNATVQSRTIGGKKYNVVSFTLQSKYKVNGYINDQNMVTKVETWLDNPVLGDMLVESNYSDYKDFAGFKFPGMIVQNQGGFPVLIVAVSDVKTNVPVIVQQPAVPATQAVTVLSEKVADGVFYLRGGTHHSVAVEFSDHVVVIEAPQNEERSLAVIAEVKKQIPGKPIRYLVNTHHHFDHSGGLRAYVDEGATIVTHQVNKAFYEKTFAAPHTLNPDRLAQSRKKANIEAFSNRLILSDNRVVSETTRALELHLIKGSPHHDGILMAYLPKERIVIEVDVYTPPNVPPTTPAPAVNPATVNLVENLERLGLEFDRILPLHGPGVATKADLYRAVGKPVPGQTPTGRGRGGQ
jgi:glyoxylase-like metal-dependent hydrolase (beta-lactamase superfamily II)